MLNTVSLQKDKYRCSFKCIFISAIIEANVSEKRGYFRGPFTHHTFIWKILNIRYLLILGIELWRTIQIITDKMRIVLLQKNYCERKEFKLRENNLLFIFIQRKDKNINKSILFHMWESGEKSFFHICNTLNLNFYISILLFIN